MTSAAEARELLAAGRIEDAATVFEALVASNPSDIEARRGFARCCHDLRRFAAARENWSALLRAAPDDREALLRLGACHQKVGRYREAVDCFDKILKVTPDDYEAQTIRLQTLIYADGIEHGEIAAAGREWGRLRPAAVPMPAFANLPEPERRLRIGYVSSDFRAQPTGLSMIPVLHFHQRPAFEIHSYVDLEQPDAASEELRRRSDHWTDIGALDDAAAAQAIRDDGIDILVVLTPHMDRNRPFICRHRAAPVQAAFHDPLSTAIPEIDYFIADRVIAPKNGPEWFSERVVRLPCWTVHAFPFEAPEIAAPPTAENGYVTFGCFNNPIKITSTVVSLWCRILREVSGSRLCLKYYDLYDDETVTDRLREEFTAGEVDFDRIDIIASEEMRSAHFAQYNKIDIALDPFPFNGATTTFEAMMMGVPVVALMGDRLVARSAASLLDAAGLSSMIASSADDYVMRAVELARNEALLAGLRQSLRGMVEKSRLLDARRYTRNLERFYRAMWREWCREAEAIA